MQPVAVGASEGDDSFKEFMSLDEDQNIKEF